MAPLSPSSQESPPFDAGTSTMNVLCRDPPPQVWEHFAQGDQLPTQSVFGAVVDMDDVVVVTTWVENTVVTPGPSNSGTWPFTLFSESGFGAVLGEAPGPCSLVCIDGFSLAPCSEGLGAAEDCPLLSSEPMLVDTA